MKSCAAIHAPETGASVPGPVRVEKLVPGGMGYARLPDGRVALVHGVAPGDLIKPTAVREHRGFCEINEHDLISPGPARVDPECSVATQCGGCDWMILDAEAEARHKLEIVREALRRTGKIAALPVELELVRAPGQLGYRSRIRLHVDSEGRFGFYSQRSHDLVPVARCAVSSPAVNDALFRLEQATTRHPGGLAVFSEIDVRAADGAATSLHFKARPELRSSQRQQLFQHFKWLSQPTSQAPASNRHFEHNHEVYALLSELGEHYLVSLAGSASPERLWHRYSVRADTYTLAPPGSFTQVNWAINQILVADVVRGAEARNVCSFLDLYSGNGNFTLPLLSVGLHGTAIESNPSAALAAQLAARQQGFANATFIHGDVGVEIKRLSREKAKFDLVLVDPPRAGVGADLSRLAKLTTKWLVVCSCDPVTLARDLRMFLDDGFELRSLCAYDMFPRTHHVEVLAWLERKL